MKLPDFPWDTLAPYGDRARRFPAGIIDLSQGTPVDPTPDFIQRSLQENSNSPSYPVTAGTNELRDALKKYSRDVLGASGDFDVLPTIGSKELVAWLPTFLESQTVLIPEIAYPSYKVGALIAGAQVHEVGIDPAQWPNADLTWINTPSNPTGRVHSKTELLRTIEWARVSGRVLASDECYVPFPDTESPVSILSLTHGDNSNIIAVHSLSKRSNFAGYRGAFIVGDSRLIKKLLEIRKHAGMMVPLPVQHAMTTALGDESHVLIQAERYRARRKVLKSALETVGFTIEFSGAGLYLWCTRNESDWESVGWLADRGILATPGSFYGTAGSRYIRVALTATDTKISEAAERIIHGN